VVERDLARIEVDGQEPLVLTHGCRPAGVKGGESR